MSIVSIETARLRLRRISADDWRGIHAYMSDPGVTAWLPEGILDENGSKTFAASHAGDEPKAFAAANLDTGEILGHMVFHPYAGTHTYEIGWVFAKAAQGQGYATEAASALLAHAFETLKCHRVIATCQPENIASWRVMEKLGMRREGLLRQCIYRGPGLWWDEYVYAVLAEEYFGDGA